MTSNITVQYPQAYEDLNGDLDGVDPTCDVRFNEFGAMFSLESRQPHREGEIEAYCSARHLTVDQPNQTWLLEEFFSMFRQAGIVEPVMDGPNMVMEECDESENHAAVLCNIIHPEFNDDGFSSFGDFCRERLGQQCQYGSRYIDGRLEGYPALGEGLRFNNGKRWGQVRELDASDYHSIRIHRDDMDEFERRYKAYRPDNSFGMRTEVREWLQNG